MIVVLGRPGLRRVVDGGAAVAAGLAADISIMAARGGAEVELMGSVGDDPEGDLLVVDLGRSGVRHAAVLRDPAGRTPLFDADGSGESRRDLLPRLDAADISLGLGYLPACRVLVLADALDPAAMRAALDGAAYHGSAVIAVIAAGAVPDEGLPSDVTVIEAPESSAGAGQAFASVVAGYAVRLDRGEAPAEAFHEALGAGAWEPAAGESTHGETSTG